MSETADQRDDPIAVAEAITRRSASNLWFVGRCLPSAKRRLFEASYASMREIDDFVDDSFLMLSRPARDAQRLEALDVVAEWERDMTAAVARGQSTSGRWTALSRALADTAGHCDLGPEPWQALAGAMRRDVEEAPISDWPDFLSYCEGATVAPAAVFLYVLQAEHRNGERELAAGLSAADLFNQARAMAVFCYLVHIVRDIARDGARGGQLVTVPADMLERHGLTRDGLLAADSAALLKELTERAADYRAEADRMRAALAPSLPPRERTVLTALLSIYGELHDRLMENPCSVLGAARPRAENFRSRLLERFGLRPLED